MGIGEKISAAMGSPTGKVFLTYLYGWGAAVVILGALFKIQHYPGASLMLILGLSTEALIFFFSVWEPPAEHLDWSLVYPELAHMDDHDDEHAEGMITSEESDKGYVPKGTVTEQLDRMLEDAKIGPELIQSLSQGMKSLSTNASNLSDLSDAAAATEDYSEKVKQASSSIGTMSQAYEKGNQAMQDLAGASSNVKDNLSSIATSTDAYSSSMSNAAEKMGEMNNSYGKAVTALDEIASSSGTARNYSEQMNKLTDNLTSLNSIYEVDLMESNTKLMNSINDLSGTSEASKAMTEQMNQLTQSISSMNSSYLSEAEESKSRTESVKQFYSGINDMMQNLQESAEGAKRSRDEVAKLGENLSALNNIYGNMLSAMNIGARSASQE
jgi:gliding motility-associated protein GldL